MSMGAHRPTRGDSPSIFSLEQTKRSWLRAPNPATSSASAGLGASTVTPRTAWRAASSVKGALGVAPPPLLLPGTSLSFSTYKMGLMVAPAPQRHPRDDIKQIARWPA